MTRDKLSTLKSSPKKLIGSLLIIVFLIIGIGLICRQSSKQSVTRIDLIKPYDWSHLAGAEKVANRVKITPLDRKIVRLDGATYQDNPAVNIVGPSLEFSGNFKLDVSLADFNFGDSLQLYGGVPTVYDEWRFEPASLKISPSKDSITAECWDGNSPKPSVTQLSLSQDNIDKLQLIAQGKNLWLGVNDSQAKNLGCKSVLKHGHIWFGVGNKSQSTWTLGVLKASSSKKISVQTGLTTKSSTDNYSSLQRLASTQSHKIQIGAAVSLNPLLTDKKYRELALNQFSIWTPENELKPQFIHPTKNTYSFTEADLLVDTAGKNKIAVHGHALVFGEANPRWINDSPKNQRQSIMTDHITRVMAHFAGRVKEWDVINEPLSDNDADYANGGNGLRQHIWYQAMGRGYVATALTSAHQADPNAKLYINDYGLEEDGQRWDAMIELVQKLQAQGIKLDGIGFEAHVYEDSDHIDAKVLSQHIKQLAGMGLSSRISEIDVHGDDTSAQATEYADVLQACLDEPSCTAFSTWGITDKYGSTTDIGIYPLSYGDDLIWDKKLKAKPVYDSIVRTLGQVAKRP